MAKTTSREARLECGQAAARVVAAFRCTELVQGVDEELRDRVTERDIGGVLS